MSDDDPLAGVADDYRELIATGMVVYRWPSRHSTAAWRAWIDEITRLAEKDGIAIDAQPEAVEELGFHLGWPVARVLPHDARPSGRDERWDPNAELRDPLTGLLRYWTFDDRVQEAFEWASRGGCEIAVIAVDVKHMKDVNDQFGFEVGDAYLIETARRIVACVRDTDSVMRSGDSFEVLMADATETDVRACAERIRRACRVPFETPLGVVVATVSVGIAFPDVDALDGRDLCWHAEVACKTASRRGGDRIEEWSLIKWPS